MKKVFTKIAGLSVGLALAVGVGVAVGSREAKVAKAAEYKAYTLDGTSTQASEGDNAKYDKASTVTQSELTWSVYANTTMNPWRFGGKSISGVDRAASSTAAVSSENISKVVLSVGTATITVNSVTLNVGTTQGDSTISSIEKTYTASSDITFNRPDGKDWSNKFFSIVFNCTNSTTSNKYVQLIKAEFFYEVEVANPDTVTVSGENTVSVGETTTLTATATKDGSATGVDQNVVWSSLDESKAIVSSDGVVTGVSNGTVTIRATAAEVSSVFGDYSVTVSGGKSDDTALIFTKDDTNFGGYGNYSVARQGVFMHFKQTVTMSNSGNYYIQLQTSNGLIENISAAPAEITRIELELNSDDGGSGYKVLASADGETYSEVSSTQLYENRLLYTVSSGNYYFQLQAGTSGGTLRLNEILVGLGNDTEEKMDALAAAMNDILDDECKGSDDTSGISASKWAEVEAAYTGYAHEAAKSALAAVVGYSYAEVNQFLSRYDYIVGTYSYSNFLNREVQASSAIRFGYELGAENNNTMIIVVVIASVSALAFTTLLIFKKKKQK